MTKPTVVMKRRRPVQQRHPVPPEVRRQRQLRLSAYHEAGHVASGVAVGFGMPLSISLESRGDSLAHVQWNYNPLLARGDPDRRERAAMHCLAGDVAKCRARGWIQVDPVRYFARLSNWMTDGRPIPSHLLPAGWAQYSDLDQVALLYSPSDDQPRRLPDALLRRLWTRTAELIDAPVVWDAIDALARAVLACNGPFDRTGLYDWLRQFPALEGFDSGTTLNSVIAPLIGAVIRRAPETFPPR